VLLIKALGGGWDRAALDQVAASGSATSNRVATDK